MNNLNEFLIAFNDFLRNNADTFDISSNLIEPEITDYIITVSESYSEKMMCLIEENQITSTYFIDNQLALIMEACMTMGFLLKDKLDRYKLDMLLDKED